MANAHTVLHIAHPPGQSEKDFLPNLVNTWINLHQILDHLTLLRLLTFLLFGLSDFLAFVAIYIPYTYLPPLALAHNILPGLH